MKNLNVDIGNPTEFLKLVKLGGRGLIDLLSALGKVFDKLTNYDSHPHGEVDREQVAVLSLLSTSTRLGSRVSSKCCTGDACLRT